MHAILQSSRLELLEYTDRIFRFVAFYRLWLHLTKEYTVSLLQYRQMCSRVRDRLRISFVQDLIGVVSSAFHSIIAAQW